VETLVGALDNTLLGERIFWQYLSIPLVAAVVGYYTNWIAIHMTFHPLRFWGIPPWLGWQGIIPKKAEKMASTFIKTTMYRLGSLPELFTEMDPDVITRHVDKVLAPRLDHYSDDVLAASQGQAWETAPQMMRRQVYAHVRRRIPELVRAIVADVGHRIDELLDFEHMVVTRLTSDKALLNRLFLESGRAEFKLVIDCGYYFGFLFGLLQLLWWLIYPAPWTLAFAGAVHGWLTNYLALNLIFRPLRPTKVGPWTIQGLFLRRQKEVAGIWCHIVTREILTIRAMMRSMLTGPRAARAQEVIRHHLRPLVKEAVDAAGPIAQMSVGSEGIGRIEQKLGDKAVAISSDPFEDERFNEERAEVVERMLRERMVRMRPEEFQDLLRPCFKEDEKTLLALGSVVGFVVGLLQHWLFFAL
jgi:uncharacterized membrane protein YheB (UPF0754 family)